MLLIFLFRLAFIAAMPRNPHKRKYRPSRRAAGPIPYIQAWDATEGCGIAYDEFVNYMMSKMLELASNPPETDYPQLQETPYPVQGHCAPPLAPFVQENELIYWCVDQASNLVRPRTRHMRLDYDVVRTDGLFGTKCRAHTKVEYITVNDADGALHTSCICRPTYKKQRLLRPDQSGCVETETSPRDEVIAWTDIKDTRKRKPILILQDPPQARKRQQTRTIQGYLITSKVNSSGMAKLCAFIDASHIGQVVDQIELRVGILPGNAV